ncbi:MAG TPA: ATP-grasp domain-containing protein, partial [Acidimicrobiia bacterium]|nr:ATP-grasp domain-containing protein [Acidimicrobiia bacterium]
MSRVLLLLPSGTYKAPDFLAAARCLGVDVVVASETEQTLAEAMGDRALVIDLGDPTASAAAIAALADRNPLDAIVAVDDQGVLIAAEAARTLGLPANAPEAVARTRNKAAMRAALAGAPTLRQPAFRIVEAGRDVVAAAEAVGWPVVVKPVSLSASRGVIRADDPAAVGAAAARIRAILDGDGHPADEPLLVEQYVGGDEVAVEALLRRGELEVLAVFDKPDPLTGPYFEET